MSRGIAARRGGGKRTADYFAHERNEKDVCTRQAYNLLLPHLGLIAANANVDPLPFSAMRTPNWRDGVPCWRGCFHKVHLCGGVYHWRARVSPSPGASFEL